MGPENFQTAPNMLVKGSKRHWALGVHRLEVAARAKGHRWYDFMYKP